MRHVLAAFFFVLLTTGTWPAKAIEGSVDDLVLFGQFSPPLTFIKDDKIVGIFPDFLADVIQRVRGRKTRDDITLVPWSRGYQAVQQDPNVLLFPMIRTPLREDLFHWVGPVISSHSVIIAKKSRNIEINSRSDLKKYTIGALRDDIGALALREAGLVDEEIFFVTAPHNALQMLTHDRIDGWSNSRIVAQWQLQLHGHSYADYEVVFTLKKSERYFAVSKGTDPEIISALQRAVDTASSEGVIGQILHHYLPGGGLEIP